MTSSAPGISGLYMRHLPWSLSWFVITGVIFLLQLIPVTGVFLMLLAAPLWSVLTINVGFAFLAVEAGVGRVSRMWLLAPIAWFGGYAAAAELSERAYGRLDAELRAENEGRTAPFDPATGALAFADNADDLGQAASRAVRNYRLAVAYVGHNRDRHTARKNELPSLDATFTGHRIADAEACRRLGSDPRLGAARASGTLLTEKNAVGRRVSTGVCVLSLPEVPSLPIWRVEARSEMLATFMLAGKVVRITITAPDGRRTELRSGQAAPLSRWPMPAMGCALNSARPAWVCDAGFLRQKSRGLGGSGAWGEATFQVVAGALKLEPASAASRIGEAGGTTTQVLDELLARHERAATANLDLLLRDPTQLATVHHLAGLAERPDLLASRADTMVAAMSAALAHGKGSSESARNLQRLLAALPDADLKRVGPDLLRRLDEGRPIEKPSNRQSRERIDGTLALRIADLGAPALPLLERLALAPRGDSAAHAILGLCRMSPPPDHLAPRLAEQLSTSTSPTSETRAAAYVTLVRWKRSDLAEQLIDEQGRNRSDYRRRWPGLSEDAGREFCTFRKMR